MTKLRTPQDGVSLVELMVSMVIGLVIMIAVGQAYLDATSSSRIAETQARMNEDAQTALAILVQQLKLAGANPLRPDRASSHVRNPFTPTYIVRACDIAFTNTHNATSIDTLTCSHIASSTGPASLAISYEADRFNSALNSAGVPADCVGNGLNSISVTFVTSSGASKDTSTYQAHPVYYIDTGNSPRTLSCRNAGASGSAQPLIENVEDLQLSFGVATVAAPDQVQGYLRAQAIDDDAGPLGALPSKADRWALVRTVRICLLMRSGEAFATSIHAAQYNSCNDSLVTNPPDLRLRRAYTTTVVLRNRS
jgi:type IV pilus assembly protein PilW